MTGEKDVCDVRPGNHGGCFESIRICESGIWGQCRPTPGELTPGGEACNGEDEDCDGEIDEDLGEFSCGLGACRNTVPACTRGVHGICLPLEPQTDTDGCNDIDDDCDGAVDEDCGDCVHVAPDGDDQAALANDGASPFRNVQPAIDFAAASGETRVCVAAGAACGASVTYPGPATGDLTMQNGVSVLGGYESIGWTRCDDSTTTLAPATARGVYFPEWIERRTALDGFTLTRAAGTTTAGVTVEGGRGVVLSNLRILSSVAATSSYGVNLTNGAEAAIVRSLVDGGPATEESIGVRAVGARVHIEDNCRTLDPMTGRCAGGGCSMRTSGSTAVKSLGVALDDAPGSRIERSDVCAGGAETVTSVRIRGDASGIVLRGNTIDTFAYDTDFAHGVELSDCGNSAPRIIGNEIWAQVSNVWEQVRGVSAVGACHPVMESNEINAGRNGAATRQPSAVVHCGSTLGMASRCVIAGNEINGRFEGHPLPSNQPTITGIDCAGGGCAKISRNNVTGRKPVEGGDGSCSTFCNALATSLRIESGGPFVDRNEISLGCISSGVAVSLISSWSRFQNNWVRGRSCPPNNHRRYVDEVILDVRATTEGPDIHSNTFADGDGSTECARSKNVVTWGTGTKSGTFRNNSIMVADSCFGTYYCFVEADVASDPAFLENNSMRNLVSGGLYADRDTTLITTAAGLNSMTDITCSGNVGQADLRDAGTPVGAPLWDFLGNPRDDAPSIGATEP